MSGRAGDICAARNSADFELEDEDEVSCVAIKVYVSTRPISAENHIE